MAALLKLYRDNPALCALDFDPDGFEWINNISANENMLVFLRKSSIEEQMLLVVVNFSALSYPDHKIGVPFRGKYKEIFTSDAVSFGGEGNVNPRVKTSKADECDELPNSIRILVPPMGVSVFSCTRLEKPEKAPVKAAEKKSAAKTLSEETKKSGSKKAGAGSAVKSAARTAARTAKSAGSRAKTAAKSAAETAGKAAAKIAETAEKAAASISNTAEKTEK
jgi:1,4-alpha-glucan branching enzyme